MPFDIAPRVSTREKLYYATGFLLGRPKYQKYADAIRAGMKVFPVQTTHQFYHPFNPKAACTVSRMLMGLDGSRVGIEGQGLAEHWTKLRPVWEAYENQYGTGICEDNNRGLTSEQIAKKIEALN